MKPPNDSYNTIEPTLVPIMANRLDAIVREMSNTLQRAARSAVIAACRDFSCSIVTADNQLLSAAEGLPVHVFGGHLQTASMCEIHSDLAEGDAFLHNDPYLGNTHPADHTIISPVFFEGVHVFSVLAKAHQADIGNSIPSTYHAAARDVYEEGSLIFPCVRVQKNYALVDDVIRMCRARIRVPEQWYGDFLACLGSVRTGEKRLKQFCQKYGIRVVQQFVDAWLNYSEQRMAHAIQKLPRAKLVNKGCHDPFEPFLPAGIPIKIGIDIDPDAAIITVDLQDNIDCVACGLNQSEATAMNNAVAGVFNCLDADIPHNAGSFRRVRVLLRDGSVVGRPTFPHSCSMATGNLAANIVNTIQSAFAQLGDGFGLAEGGCSMGIGQAVVSGNDYRRNGAPYINQLFVCFGGGPAGPKADGWVNYGLPQLAGLIYRDSVEIAEMKQPLVIRSIRLLPGTCGAGRHRGSPASEAIYGPKRDPMTVIIPSNCQHNPPRGVNGGYNGILAETYVEDAGGSKTKLPNFVRIEVRPGEWIGGVENSGAGYGSPLERDPQKVLSDVLEGWETTTRALEVYGVVLVGTVKDENLRIDTQKTIERRKLPVATM